MKKNSRKNNKKAHKRALASAKRLKAFAKKKHYWRQGIGLYEIYTAEERDKPNKL